MHMLWITWVKLAVRAHRLRARDAEFSPPIRARTFNRGPSTLQDRLPCVCG